MKILYVMSSTNPLAGSSKSLLTLIRAVKAQGIDVLVVLPDSHGLYEELAGSGISALILPSIRQSTYPKSSSLTDKILFLPRLLYWRLLIRRTVNILRQTIHTCHIDLVHTNVSIIGVGLKAALLAGVPHILHIREYGDSDFHYHYFPSLRRFRRSLSLPSSYSICITHDIQAHHGLLHNPNSVVIYNGIRPRGPLVPSDKHQYFLFVGRIEPAKGLDQLLSAYATFVSTAPSPAPLLIAGEAPSHFYSDRIHRFADRLHISSHVRWLGARTDIESLMSHALALIVPSLNEGFGRCMTEAMFCGCLVIGRNTGGTKEQFDNGLAFSRQEIGFRYTTTPQLAALLRHVSQTPPSAFASTLAAASATVNHFYTTQAYTQSVIRFYHHIMSKHLQS